METGATAVEPLGSDIDFDVVIIGAGITGIHQLHRLREAGFAVRLVEAGGAVGGTWYWNRYPGARFDSESYSYQYFFSEELLQEWNWSEHFAGQAETEAYLNFAVDKLGLRDDMQFDTLVVSATFDEDSGTWTLTTDRGAKLRARYVISATGVLSVPYRPDVPGMHDFVGEQYHTGEWPHEPVDFRGKRVAVIGTGASAVQLIPVIAAEVESLTVYQRTPNWCAPLNNGPITPEEQEVIKRTHDEIYENCRRNFAGFVHRASKKHTFDDTKEERWILYEKLWNEKGFAKLLSNYRDLMTSKEANDEFSEFLAEKIRSRVDDPATADLLVPKDHGAGMKRMPMETQYYEAYNRPNVTLVDLHKTPIVAITEHGIETSDGETAFDMIVWATGFDGFTGALLRMDIVGVGGRTLRDTWADGPHTYLGMQIPGFPNFFTVGGPHLAAGNFPRATEMQVDFVTGLLLHMREHGQRYVAAEPAASEEWTEHVAEAATVVLIAESSWFRGANIPGKPKRYLPYAGSLVTFRKRLAEIAEQGYPGFDFQVPDAVGARGV
jgi:cation diffusion facilitator CzcD-associated flavoprotein CzcO